MIDPNSTLMRADALFASLLRDSYVPLLKEFTMSNAEEEDRRERGD